MDPRRAAGEVARVLVPGGQLGLLWNVRDKRAAVLAAVRYLLDTHPALADAAEVVLPYVTRCSRAFLPGAGPVSGG